MKNINNYTIIESKYLEEEQSQTYLLEHDKTKAKIFIMENDDDNKLFSIGFRTPPFDSSGVCHILEHCVLNGSKKYRTREPFMDMIKSSLQTFLNAMTFSDKTLYPVASRNTKDFENLMDVYLDAVFNPRVKEKKEIFLQEGWRYDLDEDNKLTYKGVVYNEMKGAMSSAEDQVFDQIYENLFPDTIYSLNSGGDPYQIPNLSYERFIEYYDEFYHPSNSYIFLYGNMNYEKYLSYIHEEYLSKYEYREVNSSLQLQRPFNKKIEMKSFFSTTKEIHDNSNMISYSVVTSDTSQSYDRIMNELLKYVLINSESSPLKIALNQLEIVDDIINASGSTLQSTFSIIGKNIREEDATLFVDTIENTLKNIVEDGIDEKLIKSMLNLMSFSLKEKNGTPTKGIEYLYRIFDTWLYDRSPISSLDIYDTLAYIENNISNGIFEKYIDEKILNNNHKLIILHKPKLGLNDDKDKKQEEYLDNLVAKASLEELDKLRDQRINMDIFQSSEDTPEEKATIPTLSISDVNSKFDPIDRKILQKDNHKYITHKLPTAGIDYINFVFDINHISKEDIPYVSLLADILGLLNTKNYTHQDLFTKIFLETGGISFGLNGYYNIKTEEFNRTLIATTKSFSGNVANALDILEEITLNTLFNNSKRIKELINMVYSRMEMNLLDYAHQLVSSRASSTYYIENDFLEKVGGIDAYLFYKELQKKDLQAVLSKLEGLYKDIFKSENLIVNITSDFTNREQLEDCLENFISKLDDSKLEKVDYEFEPTLKKEALITSTDVSYVSIGNNLGKYGYKYKGSSLVISNIISNNFLYSEIRAKGGAYGAGMGINSRESFVTYSYRDPNIVKTIDTYNKIGEVIKDLKLSESELTPFVIGAIGKFDPPLTERAKGRRDLDLYLSGKNYTDIEESVQQAKETSKDDIIELSEVFDKALNESSLVVLTSESKYIENKDLFDNVIKLS